MSTLILHAVGIDELRELFSGSSAGTDSLRQWAAEAYPPPEATPRTRWLGRLGPMTRHQPQPPVIRADVPTGQDLEDITRGRDVPADRLGAAWALVDLWLSHRAWSALTLDFGATPIDAVDFAGSLAGVPADSGLRHLLNGQLALPLRDQPGQTGGYIHGDNAHAMGTWWAGADSMTEPAHELVGELGPWLQRFPEWTDAARAARRPSPDLIALWREGTPWVSS